MIAKLTGKVDEVFLGSVILDVSGVGYKVFLSNGNLSGLITGKEISLLIHHVIRETASDLYGFMKKEEKDFFELLLSVSGIGPKSALAVLNSASIETLHEGITSGDASYLTKVSGIGKKSAGKIIVELRDKIGTVGASNGTTTGSGAAIEALTALGYSEREARDAIQKMDKELSTEEMIKEALKYLG